jgi:hypothetical protein
MVGPVLAAGVRCAPSGARTALLVAVALAQPMIRELPMKTESRCI